MRGGGTDGRTHACISLHTYINQRGRRRTEGDDGGLPEQQVGGIIHSPTLTLTLTHSPTRYTEQGQKEQGDAPREMMGLTARRGVMSS